MNKDIKFGVLLPYDCLFDLRWGFIRMYSKMDHIDLYSRFDTYCNRTTDDLTTIVPSMKDKFKITPNVVSLSPRTAIMTIVTNVYRQFAAERPDTNVTMHITIDFHDVPFIPNDQRQHMCNLLMSTMSSDSGKVHITHDSVGYDGYPIKKLRKKFNCIFVYDIGKFVETYNANTPSAYHGLGIITRPLFIGGRTPEDFHKLINGVDKRNVHTGSVTDPGDHYDILNDTLAHIGPIYFHEPQYFSAIAMK